MGLASHLGPWLLGSIKNSTGNVGPTQPNSTAAVEQSVNAARNMGGAIVAQNNFFSLNGIADNDFIYGALFLPAGAQLLDIYVDVFETAGTASVATMLFVNLSSLDDAFAGEFDLKTQGRNSILNQPTLYNLFVFANPQFPMGGYNYSLPSGGMINGPGTGINYPPENQVNWDIDLAFSVTGGPITGGIINVTALYQVRNPDGSINPEYGAYYPQGPNYYTGP
jgi:hypothetical protein